MLKPNALEKNPRKVALLWMVIGGVAVLAFSLIMNQFGSLPHKEVQKAATSVSIAPPPPPPPPKAKPKPKPKAKPKAPPKAAPPSIGSSLSGVDMGLPGFGDGMSDMGNSLLGDMSNVVMTADSVDVAPQPATRTAFEYPKKARKQGVEGYVVVNLLIDESGRVEKAKVLESYPEEVFDDVVKEGITAWVFKPAMYQGKQVKVWAKQKIRFSLN